MLRLGHNTRSSQAFCVPPTSLILSFLVPWCWGTEHNMVLARAKNKIRFKNNLVVVIKRLALFVR